MNVQQEEQLVTMFSKEIKHAFFHRIPSSEWKMECITEHTWLFGVRNETIDTYPYLYSLHFDWKNRLFTLRLEQEVVKSTHLFPHVYHRFLHFLKERHLDVFIHNDNFSLKPSLYKKKLIPLHATGVGAEHVLLLLEEMKKQLPQSSFYFWKEQQSIHFYAPFMPNVYHTIHFIIDEKQQLTQGMIDVRGCGLKTKEDIQNYFFDFHEQFVLIQNKEREIIDYLAQLNKNSYYDPHSESLMIFKKNIPFSIQTFRSDEKKPTYTYAIRFGSETKQSSSLVLLMEDVKKDIYDYVIQDRLRAVVEGRA